MQDYDSWDKTTKPANFNMKADWRESLSDELRGQVLEHEVASNNRHKVQTPVYNGRPYQRSFNLDDSGLCLETVPTTMESEDFYDIQTMHTRCFPGLMTQGVAGSPPRGGVVAPP